MSMGLDELVSMLTIKNLENSAQFGDYIGGVWGTVIGTVTMLVVLFTWMSTRKIDNKSKIYQVFAEMLRTHEEIISSIRLDKSHGRDAFSGILSEFYITYKELDKLCISMSINLSIEERMNISFTTVYYGPHPHATSVLERFGYKLISEKLNERLSIIKRSNVVAVMKSEVLNNNIKFKTENLLWIKEIGKAYRMLNDSTLHQFQKKQLKDVLDQASKRNIESPLSETIDRMENILLSSSFSGHQNRLSHYFRNLYLAFVFIDKSSLSKKEKESLSDVIRSKLSNYEQALLSLNIMSNLGQNWKLSGINDKYMPIRDIPRDFFSFDERFDLKGQFPKIVFEWECRRGFPWWATFISSLSFVIIVGIFVINNMC